MDRSDAPDAAALALVHQGWRHLRLQRPLAAWASWQQALRQKPGDPAATEALDRLAGSPTLPRAATQVYRLNGPEGESRRARWDRELRGGDRGDLAAAEGAFARLATIDPDDASAWYNLGLCRAWRGENLTALGALHRFVALAAARDFDAAADAWTLAEVLRHGAGAEEQADDLSWSVAVSWDPDGAPPRRWLDAWPHREITPDPDPLAPPAIPMRMFELLNVEAFDPPRVEGTLVVAPGRLLFSTLWHDPERPWPEILDENRERLGLEGRAIGELEAHVLPLHLLDSQALAFRLPDGLDAEERLRRSAEALDEYYRVDWGHAPRHGLSLAEPDPHHAEPPWQAGERVSQGSALAAAQLEGVIRLREQLARRPQAAALYGAFSFDRVRTAFQLKPRWSDDAQEPTRDDAAD
jgi:tetratricopeptide (TPR) repeat protein